VSAAAPQQASSILPLSITSITSQTVNGVTQLVANGLLGSQAFTSTLTLTASTVTDATTGMTTPILNLHLGAIHLDLLGLKVDTSEICLSITAQSGSGNLLGNLLTDVANLLNNNSQSLNAVLGGLSSTDLTNLTSGLTDVLNGALGQVTAPSSVSGATGNILHLSLGPVDLNLLGLNVHLDNCANGPVTIDVTAQQGPGRLLGNLLGGLSHLLDSNANLIAIGNKLDRIAHTIAGLV